MLLTSLSFISGGAEAAFLVVVTRSALAIANGKSTTGVLAGWTVPVAGALLLAAALVVVRVASALWAASVSTGLTARVGLAVRADVADAYLRASWTVQQSEPSGRLLQVIGGFASSVASVVTSAAAFTSGAVNLMALLLFAVAVDPAATGLVAGALFALGAVLAPIRLRIRVRSRSAARAQMEMANVVSEVGALGLEMHAFGAQAAFRIRIALALDHLTRLTRRAQMLQAALPQIYTTLAFAALLGGIGVASQVGIGELSAFGSVMLVMLRALSYGQQVQTASGGMNSYLPYLDEIDSVLAEYRRQPAPTGHEHPEALTPIDFVDVSFRYTTDRPALTNASFSIQPGEFVGVIGPSGAGKSTLVQLLLGLREPTEGIIRMGGTDLQSLDRDFLARRVTFVPQDPSLLTGTVAENIRFFRDWITDNDIRVAADAASLLGDVEQLPNGFGTHLGERGSQLSGGQRQRISIARALVGAPDVLVMDEPTSALDAHSELAIKRLFEQMHRRVTVVVIAHRLSTLESCDRIMVVHDGRVQAFDSPANLRADSEFYRTALAAAGLS